MGGSVVVEKRALFSLLNVLSALYLYEVNKPSQSQKNRQTAARRKFVEGEQFLVTCIRQTGIRSLELVNLIF